MPARLWQHWRDAGLLARPDALPEEAADKLVAEGLLIEFIVDGEGR